MGGEGDCQKRLARSQDSYHKWIQVYSPRTYLNVANDYASVFYTDIIYLLLPELGVGPCQFPLLMKEFV